HARETHWDGTRVVERPNLGYKPRYKEGYFPVAPIDSLQDIRTEMCRVMEQCGIQIERQHHEVATAGQAEIDIRYDSPVRTAAIRIPTYPPSPKATRIEFRSPDPSCNPYLAFAAMIMAGLDGIENRIDPGDPLDKDIYGLSPEELKDVPKMPGSLEEALGELKKDHEFLLKGDVFTEDVIEAWIDNKIERELNPVRLRPTPTEFALYFDI